VGPPVQVHQRSQLADGASGIVADVAFDVLIVCTGNICRSPVAARLLAHRLDPAWPVRISSAGTAAVVGYGIDAPSAQALTELGVDPAAHVARRLTDKMIKAADLVLTAETAHRSSVVQAEPLAFRRAFTLREFGRLGGDLPPLAGLPTPDELRGRVAEIAELRGVVEPPEPGADEIADPFGASLEVARACTARISEALDAVVRALGSARVNV
jgi:low molecular weight protein-tyrosine phosphatase